MKKLDFVIAWVDGSDENHRLKRQQFQPENVVKGAAEDTRFAHNDEIYFSIASILKYVPYCGTIYIITDHQQPSFVGEFEAQGLCRSGQIQVVDHQEIFRNYQQYLPTFNSLTIETMLWNIEGLSDYFIYLNDDFFFNAPAQVEDFLKAENLVIYGHWQNSFALKAKLKYRQLMSRQFGKPIQPKHMIAQMLGADVLGFKKFFEIHHYPHIVDRHALKDYLLEHPQLLETQIKFKFRSVEQLNPISLMNHIKIQKQQAELKPDLELAYLKNQDSLNSFIQALHNPEIKYGCIQSLDQLDSDAANKISTAMQEKLAGYLPHSVLV